MIEFWSAAAVMSLFAVVFLLLPLRRGSHAIAHSRADYDISVYKDQLLELGRDLESGLLTTEESEAARVEIERRMLKSSESNTKMNRQKNSSNWALITVVTLAVPVLSVLFYLEIGTPGARDLPFSERQTAKSAASHTAKGDDVTVDQMIVTLAERLEKEPGNAQNWLLFARTLTSLNRTDEADAAFTQAMHLTDDAPDVAIHYGEMLVNSNAQIVPPKAVTLFKQIITKDPANVRARYYIGLAKSQAGNRTQALQDWVDILTLSSVDAPWVPGVRRQIRAVAEQMKINPKDLTPSQAAQDLASTLLGDRAGAAVEDPKSSAAVPQDERQEFIGKMVARLANRLKENPDDLEGWVRLQRAYQVLGEQDKANNAAAQIERLNSAR
ncbi:MAG: c-type cytochrome biogenesis protein CcmI [Magnetovibrio sp.]|nr:c-type cytochrome biogenesis protein CcmI [Magnetovibrio sp.]